MPINYVSLEEIRALGKVNFDYYYAKESNGIPLTYKELVDTESIDDDSSMIFPGPSSVTPLPMVDLKPSDVTCIYSTQQFHSSVDI